MKATAIANTNIALVKYWGKEDKKLILPQNSSISLTLDGLNTVTTVEFSKKYKRDIFILNNRKIKEGDEFEKVVRHLDLIRKMAQIKEKAKIVSKNNFPTAAGLASSASGFAALSLAGTRAAGIDLDLKELSILARQGSGSATRSCQGGFVKWLKGEKGDGSDSYAIQIAPPEHWPEFRIIATIVSTRAKKISSRVAMALTLKTCPMYKSWLETIEEDLEKIKKGILEKDFSLVGKTAEFNCLKLHAVMMTTKPALIYWRPETLRIIQAVLAWREEGLKSYFTIDAGPQVKVICLEKDLPEIKRRLKKIKEVKKIIISKPGNEPKVIESHLF